MSLISGLFTFPIDFARKAYKSAYFQFPEEARESSSVCIKNIMQPFLDQVKIRKDLMFFEEFTPVICCASGTNRVNKGHAVIFVAPGFYEADQKAFFWAVKHEIHHIKSNDSLTKQCVPGICQLAASIFGMCYLSFLPALIFAFTIGTTSFVLFAKYREAKADDFAIKHSSDEELKGGRRFLMALQKVNIERRTTAWKRIVFSAKGEHRLDFLHPSIASRIKKIERALRDRNSQIDDTAADQRLLTLLKSCITETIIRAVEKNKIG